VAPGSAAPLFFEQIEPAVRSAFERSIAKLQAGGAQIEWIDLPELEELDGINIIGGFSPTESYAWHRRHLQDPAKAALYDPRVRSRIERGASMSAADYLDLLAARKRWIAKMESAMAGYDALLSPTTPITAPRLHPSPRPTASTLQPTSGVTKNFSASTACCCAIPA
jgi:amidase/aspartyl-tRNA(Asn)/glutamyl-tRNA(Gln) amidotransferase subunit A